MTYCPLGHAGFCSLKRKVPGTDNIAQPLTTVLEAFPIESDGPFSGVPVRRIPVYVGLLKWDLDLAYCRRRSKYE